MSEVAWEVQAIRYGTHASTRSELMLQYPAYGEPDGPQSLDYFFYVLRAGGRTVVVDTGFSAVVAGARGRQTLRNPADVLSTLDADTIVITHLHWDHIGNLGALPDAALLVPATELAFWRSPAAHHATFWSHTDPDGLEALAAADAAGRVRPYRGVASILPGVTAFEVGGHSAGQVVLLVQTAHRPILLCSDAVHLYEELELRRPFTVVDDLQAMYAGFDLVDALVADLGCVAIPGHDPLVADRFERGDLDEHALRLG